jgi:hypothetical protein
MATRGDGQILSRKIGSASIAAAFDSSRVTCGVGRLARSIAA